jgi:AraC-like DNA-binding protein
MLWAWDNPKPGFLLERLLPNGEAALIVNLYEDRLRVFDPQTLAVERASPGALMIGAHSRPTVIAGIEQRRVFGIQFRPGGGFAFLGRPASEVANGQVDLADLWGRQAADEFRTRLLEASTVRAQFDWAEEYLTRRCDTRIHPAVNASLRILAETRGTARISQLASTVGLSDRRLAALFHSQVGLAPKAFARVRRLQCVVNSAFGQREAAVDWTRLAHESGYSDQPHFNHDFRELAGVTPTEYLAGAHRHPNHVVIPGAEFRES